MSGTAIRRKQMVNTITEGMSTTGLPVDICLASALDPRARARRLPADVR
jgi:hypothetical protein